MNVRSNVSHEQRVAWGRRGGLAYAANRTAEERREFGSIGGKGRAAKYTSEQLQQIHANQLRTRFARMTPEQAREFQRKAGQGRWRGVTPDEHSKISRKAIGRRLGQAAYAKNQEKADRLYTFLRDYISAKGYAPNWREIRHATHHDGDTFKKLLQILERIGRIQRHAWSRGITLSPLGGQRPEAVTLGFGESPAQGSALIVVPRMTKKCYDCDNPAVAGKTRCEQHLARVREVYNRSHAKKLATGRCVQCSALAAVGKTLCERHLALHRETNKRSYAKKRR
jgi:hypothetical protein